MVYILAVSVCRPAASCRRLPIDRGRRRHPQSGRARPAYSLDVLILGGRVIDGTGNAWFHGDVAIKNGRIARITPAGLLKDAAAKERIDAKGRVVCPGFIDIQSHSREALLTGDGRVVSKVTQGVTTEIMGEGGRTLRPMNARSPLSNPTNPTPQKSPEFTGPHGFDAWLQAMKMHGPSVNFGSFVGSATLRAYVKGMDQGSPTDAQLETMRHACSAGHGRWCFRPCLSPDLSSR